MKFVDTVLNIDAITGLKQLPEKCVNQIVTSPPYYALRNYEGEKIIWGGKEQCSHSWEKIEKKPAGGKGSASATVGANKNDSANMRDKSYFSDSCRNCSAWRGELGMEPSPSMFVSHLCKVFDECYRVLKDDGTCFVNLGDTYSGSGNGIGSTEPKYPSRGDKFKTKSYQKEFPEKSLCMIPFQFALEMVSRGWILRNTIIWHKPNAMPSSAEDRFSVDFEYIFFFSKKKKYFFSPQREGNNHYRTVVKKGSKRFGGNTAPGAPTIREERVIETIGRNMRTVWSVQTEPNPEAHFATYPKKLVSRMILSGSKEGDIVLDPFMGSGTTARVAKDLSRRFTGFEINPEYCKMINKNISQNNLF